MRKSDKNTAGSTVTRAVYGAASAASIVLYRCLRVTAALVALTIVSVTVYTVISRSFAKGKPVYALPEQEPSAPDVSAADNVFSAIGRIRTFTADNQTAIVSIMFPYNREDVPFTEELVSKIVDFRNITLAFFNNRSAEELRDLGEDAVKAELLNQYNGVLKLGRIPLLYFNDFMMIE
ncbi:MAG: flagellar basal body protein FliL [Treponema sp.]|jgi:flagellar basal body-associated protein FliL|nr:flagellar basal body protein FliL [Treponema sp.]